MTKRTALVTGAGGFVARHMIPLLEREGYEVSGFDIKQSFSADGSGALWRDTDARDFFRHSNQKWDLVIGLAAVVGGREKIEGAPLDLAVDLAIDSEMIQWAMRTRPGKLVYFSSSAAYPIGLQRQPTDVLRIHKLREHEIRLNHIETPDMSYGWSKLTGEMLCRDAQAAGLDVLVVRPFSGYCGLTQSAEEYPFPALIQRARNRDEPFVVWGSGTQQRDWIHILDVCEAVVTAVKEDVQGPVNLCTGRGISFIKLAKMMCAQAGYDPEILPLNDKPMGVHTRVGDPTKMREFYTPTISLEQGIEMALRA